MSSYLGSAVCEMSVQLKVLVQDHCPVLTSEDSSYSSFSLRSFSLFSKSSFLHLFSFYCFFFCFIETTVATINDGFLDEDHISIAFHSDGGS